MGHSICLLDALRYTKALATNLECFCVCFIAGLALRIYFIVISKRRDAKYGEVSTDILKEERLEVSINGTKDQTVIEDSAMLCDFNSLIWVLWFKCLVDLETFLFTVLLVLLSVDRTIIDASVPFTRIHKIQNHNNGYIGVFYCYFKVFTCIKQFEK